MLEGVLYLASSFWLGALHAATPGHGKTVAAAYLVGARGRPADALALGVFVTLSHTSGIIAFALLATAGSTLLSQRAEAYLALAAGLVVLGLGLAMLRARWPWRSAGGVAGHNHGHDHEHDHDHDHGHGHDHGPAMAGLHHDGWGRPHSHRLDVATLERPSWLLLLGLGAAGGLLPDPAALALLLAAIASGKLLLGLLTVIVFSVGFASVLVAVGVMAVQLGQAVLGWLSSGRVAWIQFGTALIVTGVGTALTLGAWWGLSV